MDQGFVKIKRTIKYPNMTAENVHWFKNSNKGEQSFKETPAAGPVIRSA